MDANNNLQNKNLTQARSEITRDWKGEFPGLKIERPLSLLRRVGPLLVGVYLDRFSTTSYRPTFYVHFLGNSEDGLSLTMRTEFTPTPEMEVPVIEVSAHKRFYKEAARLLREAAPLSIEGPLTVKEVLEAYRTFSRTCKGESQLANLYQDAIKLATCYGFTDEAKGLLGEIMERTEGDRKFYHHGGREAYIERMREAIGNPGKIWQTLDEEIIRHKVEKIPFEEFVGGVPFGRT